MDFNPIYNNVYKSSIKAACEELGLECERIDEQHFDEQIVEKIYEDIRNADLIIAELSQKNPNLYYELGYARAKNKRIISLTKSIDTIPFDLLSYPYLTYGKTSKSSAEVDYDDLKRNLITKIQKTLGSSKWQPYNSPEVYSASRKLHGEVFDSLLSSTEETVRFAGIHFQWSLSDHEELILSRLEAGVDISYLVVNPSNENLLADLARRIGMPSTGELSRECKDGMKKLERLYKTANKRGHADKLRIYSTNTLPFGRFYLFDEYHPRGKVLHIPFVYGRRSSHSPAYLFRSSDKAASCYIESCTDLFKNSSQLYG